MAKSKVVSVVLHRGEGPTRGAYPAGTTAKVPSIDQADQVLRRWSHTAPPVTGGYNKCDFTITWDDGETYSGRYDLQSVDSGARIDIAKHVRDYLSLLAGVSRPHHWTAQQHTTYLATIGYGKTEQAEAARFLRDHELK
jgi:hypothetical protein